MAYSITFSVMYDAPPEVVYEAFCDLDSYPQWIAGAHNLTKRGPLKENMLYEYDSVVGDDITHFQVEVIALEKNHSVELLAKSNTLSYHARHIFLSEQPGQTELACMLQVDLPSFMLKLGRPVVESMVETRVRGNFEALKAMLET